MSAAPQGDSNTTKAVVDDADNADKAEEKKPAAAMEGEDEWEEFPMQDWPDEEQELPGGNAHLWEAGWDDDDANNDFSKQLKHVLQRMVAVKKATNQSTEKNSKEKVAERFRKYDINRMLMPGPTEGTVGHTLKKKKKKAKGSERPLF